MRMITIKEAKKQINACLDMYLEKEKQQYRLPQNKQRPIFLQGAAGIGKTELISQIAEERNLGMVTYSLNHHTRQSAIGMPVILEKEVGERHYQATSYTMSEIIDSVYVAMQAGHKEGILFIDEINCASETLSSVLLQFLQTKTFGMHHLPEGWIIITAGNPPEYNKAVKLFDGVTQDRLRMMHVTADVNEWMEYAENIGIHPAILDFIRQRPDDFCKFEKEKGEIHIVTPRAWEDLSHAVYASERHGYEVDYGLIEQFIQQEQVAIEFEAQYQIYQEFTRDYDLDSILRGELESGLKEKIASSDFMGKWMVVDELFMRLFTNAKKVVSDSPECWNQQLNYVIRYIKEVLGEKEELSHFLSMICRNKVPGTLVALHGNEVYLQEYQKLNFTNDVSSKLNKEIKMACAKG